jgi:hypothetical protein
MYGGHLDIEAQRFAKKLASMATTAIYEED